MIEFTALTMPSPTSDGVRRTTPPTTGFTLALDELLLPAGTDETPPNSGTDGQDDADDGNFLPDAAQAGDDVLAWLATLTPVSGIVVSAAPAAFSSSLPAGGARPIATQSLSAATGSPSPVISPSSAASQTPATVIPPSRPSQADPTIPALVETKSVPIAADAPAPPSLVPIPGVAMGMTRRPETARNAGNADKALLLTEFVSEPRQTQAVHVPDVAPHPPPLTPAPSLDLNVAQGVRAFAVIVQELGDQKPTARRDVDAASFAPLSPIEAQRHAVAATSDVQQAPLDMRHDHWPQRMIERIEGLRDAADALDTRIRVVPDALGTIDVSLRQDGDAVHVHFTAEQAATARLLQDAQPRLNELAEARGWKLGGSATDTGGTGSGHEQRPLRRESAAVMHNVRSTDEPVTDTDTRIG